MLNTTFMGDSFLSSLFISVEYHTFKAQFSSFTVMKSCLFFYLSMRTCLLKDVYNRNLQEMLLYN